MMLQVKAYLFLILRLKNKNVYVAKYFKIDFIGNRSAWRGPSSHSERPVGTEVQPTGPTPIDRFSRGESGPHCTEATLRLAFAKTPSP